MYIHQTAARKAINSYTFRVFTATLILGRENSLIVFRESMSSMARKIFSSKIGKTEGDYWNSFGLLNSLTEIFL